MVINVQSEFQSVTVGVSVSWRVSDGGGGQRRIIIFIWRVVIENVKGVLWHRRPLLLASSYRGMNKAIKMGGTVSSDSLKRGEGWY